MTESKSGEAFSLDDAAWHLASLANRDFCNVNVKYDDMQFDTVEMSVNVTNDAVLMSDLNAAYGQMCSAIRQFQNGFSLNNQNLYFINMSINADGNAKIALATTSASVSKDIDDHLWYFPDTFGYIDSVCDYFFTSSYYPWDLSAVSVLQNTLNIFESHPTIHGSSCYLPTRTVSFEYPYWPDSYGSPFLLGSRLYASHFKGYSLTPEQMCYCLDSYLGLGYDYIQNNFYVQNEHPILWQVEPFSAYFQYDNLKVFYHKLTVHYGVPCMDDPGLIVN